MGLASWTRRLFRRGSVSRETGFAGRVETFSWAPGRQPWLPGGTYVGTSGWAAKVDRTEAMSVPAVLRGRNLVCALAAFDLVETDSTRAPVRSPFLHQIDPSTPNVVTLAQTLEDLIFDSVSWWQVTSYDWAGFPATARHLDINAISMSPPAGFPLQSLPSGLFPAGAVYVLGRAVDARDIIRFDSPNPPLAIVGARAIRRAVKLAQAGEMYADDPEARAYWVPADGADPVDDDHIKAMLRDYAAARRARAEAYIPAAVKREASEVMSPADLTLAQLQARCDLEVANIIGLDPEDIGVNTTSRTYRNDTERRRSRLNDSYGPYLTAIAGRLSMNDLTRRGHAVDWDLSKYLQADPLTRWQTHQIAETLGATDVPEIRQREGWPERANLPARRPDPAAAGPTPTVPAPAAGAQANTGPTLQVVHFTAGERPGEQTLSFPAAGEAFAADSGRRRVSGMVLPYGPIGENPAGRWRFEAGSVTWNRAAVSTIKLDREHDAGQLLGAATDIVNTDAGVTGTFKVARTPAGDEALALAADDALDGLSAVVRVGDYSADPANDGVWLVHQATLTRVTLTGDPAFTGARVTKVAASAASPEGSTTMYCTACGQQHPAGPCPRPPVAAPAAAGTQTQPYTAPAAQAPQSAAGSFTGGPAPVAAAAGAPQGEQGAPASTPPVDPAQQFAAAASAFAAAVEALNNTLPREQRPTLRPATVVREPLVYALTGLGHSFVRDAWDVRHSGYGSKSAEEAFARLRKYGEQTADLQAQALQRFANAGNTTDQAQIIPPGYRPDLYVGQIPQGRPLYDSIGTRVGLADATAFKVPVWVGSSGLSGTNSEGTGPSTGTITDHTYRTVTPTAQSGEFVVTRELMDSSNPAIDVIALNAMREEYSQDTEAIIAAAIAAATDDGSPVDGTPDQSTEGCWVYTLTGTGNDLATNGIREMEADFTTHRFLAPDRMLGSPTGFKAMTKAVDDVGRSLFPFIGAQNAMGTVGRAGQSLNVDGLMVPNAWSMTSTYNDVLLFNSVDMLTGESPLLTFRFEEKGGPENIYLNIWGYFCFQILRYPGIHSLNYTAA